jgi:hypothetical protein
VKRIILLFIILTTGLPAQMALNGRVESWFVDSQDGAPKQNSRNVANEGNPTFLWRFRGYLDFQVSERSSIFSDLRLQPNGLHVDFAAIRVYLSETQTLRFQTGVLGTFIGNVAARRSSKYNPMLQLPLMYFYFTSLSDNPYIGGNDLGNSRGLGDGMRIFELGVYRPGAEILWVLKEKIDIQAGLYNSSVSNPYMVNHVERFNVAARVGVRPIMGMTMGFSFSDGPYMSKEDMAHVNVSDADQTVYDIDFSFERGHLSFFSEATFSSWRVPRINEDVKVNSYYAEGKFKFHPRYFLAARMAQMFFSEIEIGDEKLTWDNNVSRLEMSLGYYIERETLAKIILQKNWTENVDIKNDYIAIEFSAGF